MNHEYRYLKKIKEAIRKPHFFCKDHKDKTQQAKPCQKQEHKRKYEILIAMRILSAGKEVK